MSSLVHLLAVVCTKRKPRDREREREIGERDRTNSLQSLGGSCTVVTRTLLEQTLFKNLWHGYECRKEDNLRK